MFRSQIITLIMIVCISSLSHPCLSDDINFLVNIVFTFNSAWGRNRSLFHSWHSGQQRRSNTFGTSVSQSITSAAPFPVCLLLFRWFVCLWKRRPYLKHLLSINTDWHLFFFNKCQVSTGGTAGLFFLQNLLCKNSLWCNFIILFRF